MQSNQNPLFRKNPVPWYRSRLFCLAAATIFLLLTLMGGLGIAVARSQPDFHSYVWVPALLSAAAGLLCVFMSFRAWQGGAAGKAREPGRNSSLIGF